MNILVTGANGQLGCSLRRIVSQGKDENKACIGFKGNWFYFSDVTKRDGYPVYYLDMTDPEEIGRTVRDYEIDVIVNLAAYTDVEGAEDHQELAEKLNATAVGYLAEAHQQQQRKYNAVDTGLPGREGGQHLFDEGVSCKEDEREECPFHAHGSVTPMVHHKGHHKEAQGKQYAVGQR